MVAAQCSHWLGERHTNNEAEYDALIAGLQLASQVKEARRLVVEGGAWAGPLCVEWPVPSTPV